MEGGLLSLKWNNHRSSFIHMLTSLRKKDSFCDVTLACEGKFYSSHKLVLSTCSEYFQEMFQQTHCKHPVIVLKDIRSDDLEALLNYMYVGEVNVLQEKLSTLIKAAECLKVKGLAVPDDPPKDTFSEKRGSGHDSTPDSKRRRTESDHPRSKESKSHVKHSSKSSEFRYLQKENDHEANFNSTTTNPEMDDASHFSFNNENETSNKNKGTYQGIIKQEPPDNFIDLEDTKEGILEGVHTQYLSNLPQEDRNMIDTSHTQDIWDPEGSSEDYTPMEKGSSQGSVSNKEEYNKLNEGNSGGTAVLDDGSQSEPISSEDGNYFSLDTRKYFESVDCAVDVSSPKLSTTFEQSNSGAAHNELVLQPQTTTDNFNRPTFTQISEDGNYFPLRSREPFESIEDASHPTEFEESNPEAHGELALQPHTTTDSSNRPNFCCPMCNYIGYHKSNLVKHMVIHSGQKPFNCPYCLFKSAQKGNVKTHMKRKHPFLPSMKL